MALLLNRDLAPILWRISFGSLAIVGGEIAESTLHCRFQPQEKRGIERRASSMAGGDEQPLTQLRRNQACLPCRRRRIKCDAAKPYCSSCVRSHQFLKRTQPDEERDSKGVICFYEAHEEEACQAPKKRRQSDSIERPVLEASGSRSGASSYAAASGEAKVKALEAKVGESSKEVTYTPLIKQPSSKLS